MYFHSKDEGYKGLLYDLVLEFTHLFYDIVSYMVYVAEGGDFNNVCDTGTGMIWSLLKMPNKLWRGFVKLSMTKRIHLGKII